MNDSIIHGNNRSLTKAHTPYKIGISIFRCFKEDFMKRSFLWVAILSALILSCTTSVGLIYDESVPLEKSAWISTANLGTITGYNGITVEWKYTGAKMIQVPVGETLLEVDLKSEAGYTIYTGKGLIFQYNFQAGKQYLFIAGHDKESGDFGLFVYAWEIGEKIGTYRTENREGFTPFLNVEGNTGVGGPTVLE
jgi:hypothetical protein